MSNRIINIERVFVLTRARVIPFSTNKGGVLKTSSCAAFAGVILSEARENTRILIIDTDSQGNVSLCFGKNPDNLGLTLYDVLVEGVDPREAIVRAHTTDSGFIDILPSNDDLIAFDFKVLGDRESFPDPFQVLRNRCESLQEEYDYILIDCQPSLSLMTGNVLCFSDKVEVMIPFQPETLAVRGLVKMVKTVKEFRAEKNPGIEILSVFATLVDGRTTIHSEILQQARRYCYENEIPMADPIVPKSVRFAHSTAFEKTPVTLIPRDKKFPSVDCYFKIWEEINDVTEKVIGERV
jgi:chromosome partitioning protein